MFLKLIIPTGSTRTWQMLSFRRSRQKKLRPRKREGQSELGIGGFQRDAATRFRRVSEAALDAMVDRRSSDPIATATANSVKADGRWRTFGNFGRMKLMLESAREIVENDPMYRVPRAR